MIFFSFFGKHNLESIILTFFPSHKSYICQITIGKPSRIRVKRFCLVWFYFLSKTQTHEYTANQECKARRSPPKIWHTLGTKTILTNKHLWSTYFMPKSLSLSLQDLKLKNETHTQFNIQIKYIPPLRVLTVY